MLPVLVAYAMPYIEPIVAAVIIDRLTKFGKDTDWTKVKLDANRKVRAVLPDFVFGQAGEDAVVLFVDRCISKFAEAMHDTVNQKAILDLLLSGEFQMAFKMVARFAFPSVP